MHIILIKNVYKLRKCVRRVVPRLILDSQQTLLEYLFDEQRHFILVLWFLVLVEKQSGERSLTI